MNTIFRGAMVGSPSYVPRLTGPLKLPKSSTEADRARGAILTDGNEPPSFTADGLQIQSTEQDRKTAAPAPAPGGSGSGGATPADPDPAATPPAADTNLPATPVLTGAPVDLWESGWPNGRFYWTVVPVRYVVEDTVPYSLASAGCCVLTPTTGAKSYARASRRRYAQAGIGSWPAARRSTRWRPRCARWRITRASMPGARAALTSAETVEMDASIMEGDGLTNGAVACVTGLRHPITLARKILEAGRHSFFVGDGALAQAQALGVPLCDPAELVTARQKERLRAVQAGTVGAVALDRAGVVAAATSTGGTSGKAPGRVGDSPLIGCGTYAESTLGGVSCTGDGEAIIRVVLARRTLDILKSVDDPMLACRVAMDVLTEEGRGGSAHLRGLEGGLGWAPTTPLMPVGWASPALGLVVGFDRHRWRLMPVTLADVEAARARIRDAIYVSPCAARDARRAHRHPRLVKLENLQMTGSFKERGALKAPDADAGERAAASIAGQRRQPRAGGRLPRRSGSGSRDDRDAGAGAADQGDARRAPSRRDVVLHGQDYDEAYAEARRARGRQRGARLRPPLRRPAVIAGQGTIGLELLEQVPDLDAVVVPVGGGGLIAGDRVALKASQPGVQVIGVQTDALAGDEGGAGGRARARSPCRRRRPSPTASRCAGSAS